MILSIYVVVLIKFEVVVQDTGSRARGGELAEKNKDKKSY